MVRYCASSALRQWTRELEWIAVVTNLWRKVVDHTVAIIINSVTCLKCLCNFTGAHNNALNACDSAKPARANVRAANFAIDWRREIYTNTTVAIEILGCDANFLARKHLTLARNHESIYASRPTITACSNVPRPRRSGIARRVTINWRDDYGICARDKQHGD